MTEYYVALQKSRHTEFEDIPKAFVSVSSGSLEHLEGDTFIHSLIKLCDGKPAVSEDAVLAYDIIQFKSKSQCDFHRAIHNGQTCRFDGEGRFIPRREKQVVIPEVRLY